MLRGPATRSILRPRRLMAPNLALVAPRMFGALMLDSLRPEGRWTRSERETRRRFSDRLLGYSPMAPGVPNQSSAATTNEDGTPVRRIPTAEDVTTSGGIWAPTSAKRDKLGELKTALEDNQDGLDDAATPEQRLDLYLTDGVKLIAQTVDLVPADVESTPQIQGLSEWLVKQQAKTPEIFYDEGQFQAHMSIVSEKITSLLSELPADRSLAEVRDFFDPQEAEPDEVAKLKESDATLQDQPFDEAVLRFRLLLANAAVEHLKESWKKLTTLSDGDVDRAAVKGEAVQPQVLALSKLYKYIFSHASGSCSERVDAAWELLDRDEDGLLDESEMTGVYNFCLVPVQSALDALFEDALNVASVRDSLPEIRSEDLPEVPKGWRERRKEANAKKNLLKLFKKTTKNHFLDEVEAEHRLRCIYAWAEKEHQCNKLDSVLVDEGWTGRKRYVELSPKISLEEFREVQAEHFTHLNRMGKEILKSYRENLWVQQGKGRERRELIRDCLAFLTVVSIVDYIIIAF